MTPRRRGASRYGWWRTFAGGNSNTGSIHRTADDSVASRVTYLLNVGKPLDAVGPTWRCTFAGGKLNTGSILRACRLHCSAGRRRLRSFSSPASPTRRRAHRGCWQRNRPAPPRAAHSPSQSQCGGKAPGAPARTAGRISRCPARPQDESAAGRDSRPKPGRPAAAGRRGPPERHQ